MSKVDQNKDKSPCAVEKCSQWQNRCCTANRNFKCPLGAVYAPKEKP